MYNVRRIQVIKKGQKIKMFYVTIYILIFHCLFTSTDIKLLSLNADIPLVTCRCSNVYILIFQSLHADVPMSTF